MSKGKIATRRAERALAFQVLYGLSFSPVTDITSLRAAFWQSPDNADRREEEKRREEMSATEHGVTHKRAKKNADDSTPPPLPEGFAWELVEGVWHNSEALDTVIERFSKNWRLDRLGRIELTVLRLALFEMLYRADIPAKVAINEALELAKQFGEHAARNFVNGVLDAVARALETGELCTRNTHGTGTL